MNPTPDLNNARSYGIQSLDIYWCDRNKMATLVFGIRSGDIIEGEVVETWEADPENPMGPVKVVKYNFKFSYVMSGHSSLFVNPNMKKIQISCNTWFPLFVTVSDDETIWLWDIRWKSVLMSWNLGAWATAIAYHPDGDYLAVGMENGILLLLEAKTKKMNFGTYQEEFDKPSLDIIMNPKESKGAVICIKFSSRGDFMAVSFDNEKSGD